MLQLHFELLHWLKVNLGLYNNHLFPFSCFDTSISLCTHKINVFI